MSTFEQLIDRTDMLVDDTSMSVLLGDLINQGVSEIAGGVHSALLDVIIPPLPELFSIDAVTTSTSEAYVNMPTTYQRNLQLAVSAAGSEIDIAHSFIAFTETYPALDKTGIISEVVEQGGKLYYQGIPSAAEEINLHFYRKPVAMTAGDDEPDGIPEHMQIALLTNFASWKAYEFLENGIEGEIPNTTKYKNYFFEALKTLELSIPYDTRGLMLK